MLPHELFNQLKSLDMTDETRQILTWEEFWYQEKNPKGEFSDDARRESLPLRIYLAESPFASVAALPGCNRLKDGDLELDLEETGRQPASLVITSKPQTLIPVAAQTTAGGVTLGAGATLSETLLLARLAARFPQLQFSLPAIDVDPQSLVSLSQSFRRHVFRGIIMGRKPSAGLRLLDSAGLLEHFLPEVTAGRNLSQNRFHAHDIFEHLLRSVDGAYDLNEPVRWSALLHDIGKVPTRVEGPGGEASFHNHEMYSARMVVPIMKRLAVPIGVGQKVKFLVRNHMFHYTDEWSDKAVRRFVKKVPLEELQDLIALRLADRKGSGKKTAFPRALQKLIDHIDEIIAREKEFKIKDLAIDGHALMQLGIPASRQMGDILKYLHAEVTAGRAANELEVLTLLVRNKMQEQESPS